MKRIFITSLIILLGGCTTVPSQKNHVNNLQESNFVSSSKAEKVVYPEWIPLTEGASVSFDKNYQYMPSEIKLSNGMLLRGKEWHGFLKDFVDFYPISSRNDILEGLTRFNNDYDKVEKEIKFEPLRYLSGPYSRTSFISLKGSLEKGESKTYIYLKYYGSSWLFADNFKVVADDFTWQSPKLRFQRDHYTKVWEYVYLDLNVPEYRNFLEKIVFSNEAIIRFNGQQYYSDLIVTKRMKEDIGAMLKALDSINTKG